MKICWFQELGIAALTALNAINPSSNRTSHMTQHQSRHKSVNLQCRRQLQHKGHLTPRNPVVSDFSLAMVEVWHSLAKSQNHFISYSFRFIPLIPTSSCCIYWERLGHIFLTATKEHWGNHSGSNDFGFDAAVPSGYGCVARKRPHPHSKDATNLWPLWGNEQMVGNNIFSTKLDHSNHQIHGFVPFWRKHVTMNWRRQSLVKYPRGMLSHVAPKDAIFELV